MICGDLKLQLEINREDLFLDHHLQRQHQSIAFYHVLSEEGRQVSLCVELQPNLNRRLLLYVPDYRIELHILLRLGRLNHLETHRSLTTVEKTHLFSVNVAQETYLQVVTRVLNSNGDFNALSYELYRDGGRVQAIFGD